ncbi:hypothetical protein SteCoe_31924 [Stentor coeruleus]|uniref:Uncharacterized protein n=1 Tax=Stentor coeruleus TaxID=5963 RepID=A0A1R2B079_9CILI|nr:hypothetical protein SteCoe_31924 [Stentor coeruleus]
MSCVKKENSCTQEELGLISPFPKSILRSKSLAPDTKQKHEEIRKIHKRQKSVSFPDKDKLPVHTVFEVPLLRYEEQDLPNTVLSKKKIKNKGCSCIIA